MGRDVILRPVVNQPGRWPRHRFYFVRSLAQMECCVPFIAANKAAMNGTQFLIPGCVGQMPEKMGVNFSEFPEKHPAGAKAQHTFCSICGPTEVVPLLQSSPDLCP